MTVPKAYALASVTIGTGETAKTLQVLDGSVSENIKQIARALSGGYETAFRGVLERDPKVSAKTSDLAAFLTAVGVLPKVAPVVLGFIEMAADGTRGTSGYTLSLGANSLIVPRTLSCSQGADASLSFDCLAISADGIASPITYAAALPALPADASVYTLGPGGTLTGVQNVDLDFGFKEKAFKSDGAIYPTRVHIESWEPVLKVKTADLSMSGDGAPAAVTDFDMVFLKVLNEGIRDTGTVTITIPSGLKTVNQASGSHPGEASLEVIVSAAKGQADLLTVVAA